MAVTASGGIIHAPNYVDGVSDPADWPNELLKPAPWGEIGRWGGAPLPGLPGFAAGQGWRRPHAAFPLPGWCLDPSRHLAPAPPPPAAFSRKYVSAVPTSVLREWVPTNPGRITLFYDTVHAFSPSSAARACPCSRRRPAGG